MEEIASSVVKQDTCLGTVLILKMEDLSRDRGERMESLSKDRLMTLQQALQTMKDGGRSKTRQRRPRMAQEDSLPLVGVGEIDYN